MGLISGTNVTDIEDLGDLKSINVSNYIENENASEETTDRNVEHRQLGSGTFEDGTTTSVNDVWFASTFSIAIPKRLNQLYTRNIF